jgi:two-component system, sensor histidine kinase and response regulator
MNFPFVKTGMPDLSHRVRQSTFLVVDDFDTMRRVTMDQLKLMGAQRIFEADNGAEALKIMAREPIAMVLSDWNMPVMSGLELLLKIRANPKTAALPFIMITGEAERGRIQEAIRGGVSELLVKPYSPSRLRERVERALMWSRPQQSKIKPQESGTVKQPEPGLAHAPIEPAAEHASEPPTILVVDDTPSNLQLLSHLFLDAYHVRIAHNGEKALRFCQGEHPPDLVLLDIMMPEMDGLEVARKLRSHPVSEHIPVIFVTSAADEATRLKGMELGAVDFVTKPIDPDLLKIRIMNFMRYVELHRQLQADYDTMLAAARLQEDVEHITRHDMKGPLAGVIGLVQGLAGATNLTADQRAQMRLVEETSLRLLDMINLSAEIYKIETGRFVPHPTAVPVVQIISCLAELARKSFAAKRLKISIAVPKDVPEADLAAIGEPMLCYSLFQNLLKNACEAAPDHSEVRVSIFPGTPRKITIDNTGSVPNSVREHFFDKFSTTGKIGGSGLGTYSARLLAEAQNGHVDMQTSDEKNATRLTVELPAQI